MQFTLIVGWMTSAKQNGCDHWNCTNENYTCDAEKDEKNSNKFNVEESFTHAIWLIFDAQSTRFCFALWMWPRVGCKQSHQITTLNETWKAWFICVRLRAHFIFWVSVSSIRISIWQHLGRTHEVNELFWGNDSSAAFLLSYIFCSFVTFINFNAMAKACNAQCVYVCAMHQIIVLFKWSTKDEEKPH